MVKSRLAVVTTVEATSRSPAGGTTAILKSAR